MSYLKSSDLDIKRQVLGAMEMIAQEKGMLAGVALANGASKQRIAANKLEVKIQKEGRIKSPVGAAYVAGYFEDDVAKDLIVDTSVNYLVGDIIEFRTVDNKLKGDLTVGVDSIVDGTTLKVKRITGADVALEIGDISILSFNASEENSSDAIRPMHLPTNLYNIVTTIRESRSVSGRSTAVHNFDLKSAVNEARRQMLDYFARQLDSLCTSTYRGTKILGGVERPISGGLNFFCDNVFDNNGDVVIGQEVTNKKDAAGATLTQTMVDDAFQYVIENDGRLNTAYLSPYQARVISGFDEGKIVINAEALNKAENSRGTSVQILKSPISINGNIIDKIFVNTKCPKDEIRLFDRSKFYLLPAINGRSMIETVSDIKSTDSAIDGVKVGGLGDWSFVFENADIYSYRIYGLEVKNVG